MNQFLIVCPVYFDNIRKQILSLTSNDLYRFLEAFEALIHSYAWGKSESFHTQLLSLLDATLPLWISSVNQDVGDLFRELLVSYSQVAKDFRVWGIRDAIARLYDRYLAQDPSQRVWLCSEDGAETSPMEMLPKFLQDVDIRVRFRAAVLNSRLLEIAEDPMRLYGIIREKYATNTNK
jgi:ataxia telangiectasia mutated family protein